VTKLRDFIKKIEDRAGYVDFDNLANDEYIKDGDIYCKKCNTPRTCMAFTRKVRCACECQEAELRVQEQREEENKRLKEIENLKNASLIGDRYKDISFDTTETGHNPTFDNAFIRCKRYCGVARTVLNNGMGMYLYGDSGTGKTHVTSCMANDLMSQNFQVLFTNFFEIGNLIKGTFGNSKEREEDFVNKLATIDFLFIDDLGTERVTNGTNDLWLQEKIFEVLNKRYNMKKPTIFTSNYSMKELVNDRGVMKKTVDRIMEMSTVVLKLEGTSYRRTLRNKIDIPF
jgi:DNA replication protein DnaC